MIVINARNVHSALPQGLDLLQRQGVRNSSRNGPVYLVDGGVTTVYSRPEQRVIFWAERDANPFLHLYESLWMLQGRNDIRPLTRYAANFKNYSDDGVTQHAAYGHRWRKHFTIPDDLGGATNDQLRLIAKRLREKPDDRRCILQMWDPQGDLDFNGVDVPCNTTATFQRNPLTGALDMSVFCRSNDIIWGCYGANAVHFSFLLEYMAIWIGCPIGQYSQISVNWHAYDNDLLQKVMPVVKQMGSYVVIGYPTEEVLYPYSYRVNQIPMTDGSGDTAITILDSKIKRLLMHADSGFALMREDNDDNPFIESCYIVLRAHNAYKMQPGNDGVNRALEILSDSGAGIDWVVAAQDWMQRRLK